MDDTTQSVRKHMRASATPEATLTHWLARQAGNCGACCSHAALFLALLALSTGLTVLGGVLGAFCAALPFSLFLARRPSLRRGRLGWKRRWPVLLRRDCLRYSCRCPLAIS